MQQQIKDLMTQAAALSWFDQKDKENPTKVVILVNEEDWSVFTFEGRTMMFPDTTAAENWWHHGAVGVPDQVVYTAMTIYEFMMNKPARDTCWEVGFAAKAGHQGSEYFYDWNSAEFAYDTLVQSGSMSRVVWTKVEKIKEYTA